MAIDSQDTYFGRAGEFFAMSELMLRSWNVAVPVVDVGDDVFVIDDNNKATFRMQVKSSRITESKGTQSVSFKLSRTQLKTTTGDVKLIYMLMLREAQAWNFIVIPQRRLLDIRENLESNPPGGPGRPPKRDADASSDGLSLKLSRDVSKPEWWGWGAPFTEFLNQWPTEIPDLTRLER